MLVNLLDKLEQIMSRYDFLEATRVIFGNVRSDSNVLELIFILVNFSYELRQIIPRDQMSDFDQCSKRLPTRHDFTFGKLFDMNWVKYLPCRYICFLDARFFI